MHLAADVVDWAGDMHEGSPNETVSESKKDHFFVNIKRLGNVWGITERF